MKGSMTIIMSLLFFFSFLLSFPALAWSETDGVYIVYMGAAPAKSRGSLSIDDATLELLGSVKRKSDGLVRTYKHGFSGFAARLTEEEARSMAEKPEVVSVFPDPLLQLHTTRSWDFLNYPIMGDLTYGSTAESNSSEESDTIIGILDSGIWPESKSFNDEGMGPVPTRWKGVCMNESVQEPPFFYCNRKLIGARMYDNAPYDDSPRDMRGHGTHVASTAAGQPVTNASFYGLAIGTAKGGSPNSRIAVYQVCGTFGCRGSSILAAFDDAIADGVDVLSLSLGVPAAVNTRFDSDVIAIGAFHAVEHGITVVCSAGNDGPDQATVVNAAPWVITVGASTIDRDFESDVVLGGDQVIKGEGIHFSNLEKSAVYPLTDGRSAKIDDAREDYARYCDADSLEESKIKGKIVLCYSYPDGRSSSGGLLESHGAKGVIVVNDVQRRVATYSDTLPRTVVNSRDASHIQNYINSTSNPVATILSTVTARNNFPAPTIAYFSSRGPSAQQSVLKPDVTAPGVNILAAWMGKYTDAAPSNEPPAFNLLSGTSMSCPHVSGIAANIKSRYPSFNPSAIKSAIMTTATLMDDSRNPITTHTGAIATPYEYGAGEVNPTLSLNPGLVYELNTTDYLYFLCYADYNISDINKICKDLPQGFSCPANSSKNLIADINYPSIAISWNDARGGRSIPRTLTNVVSDDDDEEETTYSVQVDAPGGVQVRVVPNILAFNGYGDKQSYTAIFRATTSDTQDRFGSITWTNGKHRVQIPFIVSQSN